MGETERGFNCWACGTVTAPPLAHLMTVAHARRAIQASMPAQDREQWRWWGRLLREAHMREAPGHG